MHQYYSLNLGETSPQIQQMTSIALTQKILLKMVDREKRDFLIKKFRELLSGTVNNLDYDDLELEGKLDSDDPAVWLIWQQTWFLYDDFREHKVGLTKEGRKFFAHCILFLYSDLEYEWPGPPPWSFLKKTLFSLTLGVAALFFKSQNPKQIEDSEIWPFFREEDFEEARKTNKFIELFSSSKN